MFKEARSWPEDNMMLRSQQLFGMVKIQLLQTQIVKTDEKDLRKLDVKY